MSRSALLTLTLTLLLPRTGLAQGTYLWCVDDTQMNTNWSDCRAPDGGAMAATFQGNSKFTRKAAHVEAMFRVNVKFKVRPLIL